MGKILITGALGHIGSRLLREIPAGKFSEVMLLDNLESQRYPSLFDLPKDRTYRFIEADVTTCDFDEILKDVEVVVHLAALTNAEGTFDKVKEVEEVNFQGLMRVAEACKKAGVKLLFPSSTSVYGSAERVVNEESELSPQSPYAESKIKAEKYLQEQKSNGLKFVVCRFGTIFGFAPGIRFHTAVNKFTWQAINRQPISVWKTAFTQRRPYLYLGDCVAAINFILEKDIFDGQVYNVLTLNFTVEDITEALKKYLPSLQINFVDSKIMNQLSYDVDDSKFKALGFVPKGELHAGIGEAIENLKGIYKN